MGYISPAFSRALWNPDEPRIANIGWAMSRPGGDWLVQRVNGGEPFLQEPPLFHWLAALSFRATGAAPGSDWVPRLPSILFALLTLLAVGLAGRRLFGGRAGFFAALALSSTAEFLEIANRAAPDGMLTFFVTVGGIQLVGIAAEERLSLRRAAVLGATAGLGFLSKNLLGPAFIGLILAAVLIRRRDLLRSGRTWAGAGLGLLAFGSVVLPWLAFVFLRDPGLVKTLLWDNTVGRFGTDGRHNPGMLEFLTRNLADPLPWTPLFLAALWKLGRETLRGARSPGPGDPAGGTPRRFAAGEVLLAWIVLPFVFVLCSGSKRDLYLLSIYPALALALGWWLDAVADREAARIPGVAAVLAAGASLPAMAFLGGIWAHPVPEAVFAVLVPHLYILYLWARGAGWRSPSSSAAAAMVLIALAMGAGNLLRYRLVDPSQSYVPLGRELIGMRSRGIEVGGYRLGLREANAISYYLGEWIPNHRDSGEVEARLARGGSPAALVVEKDVLDRETSRVLKEAPVEKSFEVRGKVLSVIVLPRGTGTAPPKS